MSLIWNYLDGGNNLCKKPAKSWKTRFLLWWGMRMATRHKHVSIHESCSIHPDTKINPRNGALSIGENSTVAAGAVVQGNVRIGANSSVQLGTILIGYGSRDEPTGPITIGNDVRIAPMVMMIAADHIFDDPNVPIRKQGLKPGAITIEDDVWIAGRVNITAGVTIGRGSVIGGGSVVTKDIPPYSVAVGTPAKVIKQRARATDV